MTSCLILTFSASLTSSESVAPDYGPMTLFQLLTANEIAVRGTVVDVADARYELEPEKNFRTGEVPQPIAVIRFDTYPPSTRSGSFSEGQSLVLFAVTDGEGSVRPLGRAAEGEIERIDGSVIVHALSRPPDTLPRTRTENSAYAAYRIDADIFDQAVEGFYACYQPVAENEIERLCSDEAQDIYRGRSWLSEHLSGIAERLINGGP